MWIGWDMFAKNQTASANQYRSPSPKNIEGNYEMYTEEDLKEIDDYRLKKLDTPQVLIDKTYIHELNIALREQKSGNCDTAIQRNEKIINNMPAPSNKIKEQSYLSIAECYELQKKYHKAIENYNLLQEVAPAQTTFATKKINELQLKIQNSDDSGITSEPSK